LASRTAFDPAQDQSRIGLHFYLPIDQYITLDTAASVQMNVLTRAAALDWNRNQPISGTLPRAPKTVPWSWIIKDAM